MGIQVKNCLTPDWFTPSGEDGNSTPARFKLKPLNGEEYLEVILHVEKRGEDDALAITGRGLRLAIRFGLVGWENISNESGVVPFTRDNIGLLPVAVLSEIAQEILDRSDVDSEQEKN